MNVHNRVTEPADRLLRRRRLVMCVGPVDAVPDRPQPNRTPVGLGFPCSVLYEDAAQRQQWPTGPSDYSFHCPKVLTLPSSGLEGEETGGPVFIFDCTIAT